MKLCFYRVTYTYFFSSFIISKLKRFLFSKFQSNRGSQSMTRTQSCQSPVQMSWCEGVSVSDWEDGTVLGPAPRLCPVSLKDALSTHNWSLITISGTITNILMECFPIILKICMSSKRKLSKSTMKLATNKFDYKIR